MSVRGGNHSRHLRRKRGFTLLEATVSVSLMALLTTGALSLATSAVDDQREDDTVQRLISLRHAITGDSRIVTKEARTDFGYIGAMGTLPTSLEDLWVLGSQPAFSFDTNLRMGTGWAGPYIMSPTSDAFSDLTLDGWGNAIQYDTTTGVSASTGQTYRARLISYGADADLGGGDDLIIEIFETELFADVIGYIRDASGNPLTGVTSNMNHPSAGSPAVKTTTTDGTGAYVFDDVPFGNRSLSVEPQLVYVADTAFTKGGAGNEVEFVVQNFSENDILVSSYKAVYDEPAFYNKLEIGKSKVFDNKNSPAGTGDVLGFTGINIEGTGSSAGRIVPIRVQSGFTLALDQNIGESAEAGKTKRLKMKEFNDVDGSGGADVDMTGISFEITFSDGSIAIFTPERK